METLGVIGIDTNLDNLTVASNGEVRRFDLSKAGQVKENCRRAKQKFRRNDARIRRDLFAKYGAIQRNRVGWILHDTSASIVALAKTKRCAIATESITGIRRMYRRGTGQGSEYRAEMNTWSCHELQRQVEYKARWEGISAVHVEARGTSASRSTCGSKTYPNGQRTVFCPACHVSSDRDENAARNIMARGALRFRANGPAGEMVKRNPTTQVIREVDAGKEVCSPSCRPSEP